jgi:MYXO-CTERM domain-containing protein
MSVGSRRFIILAVTVFTAIALPSAARSALVDYNLPGDLAGNFALNSGPAGLRMTEVASGGLGNSRAIDIINALDADNTTAVYNQSSYNLAGPGQSVTISQYVLRRNGQLTNTPFAQLGVMSDTPERMDNDAAANSYASLILFPINPNVTTDVKLQFEHKVQGGSRVRADAGITATLATNHWYLFSTTLTYDTPTSLLFSGQLEDWGLGGSALSSVVFSLPPTARTITGTDQVNGDSTVWGAYRGYQEGGAELYDNFSVVPEPGSAMAALLLVGLTVIRRRR